MNLVMSSAPSRSIAFDYDRTVVAFHGTNAETAAMLTKGIAFNQSQNDHDWLGHGIYFWEFAPQQAWSWAEKCFGTNAAVVGALVRLGRCFDLFDPGNARALAAFHAEYCRVMAATQRPLPINFKSKKRLDCAVFNFMFQQLGEAGRVVDSTRAPFVQTQNRLWESSGVFEGAHIQLSVRNSENILAVWPVRRDGRDGKD